MVIAGAVEGQGERAARIAVLLGEQGLGGNDVDLRERLARFERDSAPRARDARALATRWARQAGERKGDANLDDGLLLALAFPERIAKARGGPGEYVLANGRGAFLEPTEALARERWLAVAELGAGTSRDRILSAAPLDEAALIGAFAGLIETEDRIVTDAAGRVAAVRTRRLGRVIIDERPIDRPDPALIAGALLDQVRREGLAALNWGEAAQGLRARIAFLRAADPAWPDLSDETLVAHVGDWLAPLLDGVVSLERVSASGLDEALRDLVGWERLAELDREAPAAWTAPTGTRVTIDYAAEGGPRSEVRVQELFGLAAHPTVTRARIPITLALLSPARRPIQLTRDLPGFWRGSWADVRKDMRGRYPKHPWPENPTTAPPTTRAKPRA
jgi:ATP-dependent helicase HrpB